MSRRTLFDPLDEEFVVSIPKRVSPEWEEFAKRVGSKVFGQERAIRKAVTRLIVASSGIQNTERPPSPLLFAGPPGSGKTLLAEVLATEWLGEAKEFSGFGFVSPLVKISGENYKNSHEGATLKGSPPGYIGYGDGSPLEDVGRFEAFGIYEKFTSVFNDWNQRRMPRDLSEEGRKYFEMMVEELIEKYCVKFFPYRAVLLVDEFEKMHSDVQKQFLGILDKGEIRLHNGKTIDFRNTLIIFTSNIGTEKIANYLDGNTVGFAPPRNSVNKANADQNIYNMVKEEIRKYLDPAIYSRIGSDGIVVFHSLSREDYQKIISRETEKLANLFSGKQARGAIIIKTSASFNEYILGKADSKREGARQIGRLFDKYAKERLANAIDSGQIRSGDFVLFDVSGDGVMLKRLPRPINVPLPKIKIKPQEIDDELKREIFEELDRIYAQIFRMLEPPKYPQPAGPTLPSSGGSPLGPEDLDDDSGDND